VADQGCGTVRVNVAQAIPGSSTIENTSDGNDVESLGPGTVWVNTAQTIPGRSTIGSTSDGNDVESLGLSHD